MLIDKLRCLIRTNSNWKKILMYSIPIVSFIIGLLVPSPLFDRLSKEAVDEEVQQLVEVAGLVLADGSRYDGSVIKGTKTRQGYGRLTTADSTVYEGNWRNDELPYGQRTTSSSVYRGRFDKKLNNEGFGIIEYSEAFIDGKRKQGMAECDIVQTYIGNWHNNNKQGLGRSVKVDGSMDFGRYDKGVFQAVPDVNYRVGGSVYGVDFSHYQKDVDWDNLALYCDKDGNVYNDKPKDKKYMQPVFFVYLKATEGATIKDETYSVRTIEAERHGVLKGAYHFLHLSADIDAQIKNFLETVTWNEGDLPPALDVEVDAQAEKYGKHQVQDMTFKWLSGVEKRLGVRPIIYTRERFRDKYLREDSRFAKYKCWISRYNDQGPDNKDWKIWQFTEKGSIRGYAKAIDINIYKDDYTAFQKYLNGLSRR